MGVFDESLSSDLIGEVRVDIADVRLVADSRDVRWRHLPGKELLPADCLEEWMDLDLFGGDTIVWVSLKEAAEQVSCIS